jgi:hypothetical protein
MGLQIGTIEVCQRRANIDPFVSSNPPGTCQYSLGIDKGVAGFHESFQDMFARLTARPTSGLDAEVVGVDGLGSGWSPPPP